MSFQPSIVGSGLGAWQFLKATETRQRTAFEASPLLQRDTDYFAENYPRITTAQDLVDDRRLLRVALGAHGLQDDIDNRFFIKKIIEDGVDDRSALANKLADDRYRALAESFQHLSASPNPFTATKPASGIIEKFRLQQFEVAVGETDQNIRLALNFERVAPEIAASGTSEEARWFRILGNPPMRQVFETALNLPSSFSQIDLNKQVDIIKEKAMSRFGFEDVSSLTEAENVKSVIQSFLLGSQIKQFSSFSGGAQVALTLLSASAGR